MNLQSVLLDRQPFSRGYLCQGFVLILRFHIIVLVHFTLFASLDLHHYRGLRDNRRG